MKRRIPDSRAYEKLKGIFKKNWSGITLADAAAGTGLSLTQIRDLAPLAADEYSARLEVTESGEILYSFPQGFKSRYRGIVPVIKRQLSSILRIGGRVLMVCFKAWIMLMLIGYFLLFMAIALASLFLSVAASSNSNNRRDGRGGVNVSFGLFGMIFRLWFYSEMINGAGRRYGGSFGTGFPGAGNRTAAGKGRPLHRAIFSFVFGEENPNPERELQEKKEFISYVRSRRGVVALPELMSLLGQSPQEAETKIMSFCAEFGGVPEVTEEGTIVYRFEEILLSGGDSGNYDETSSVSGLPQPFYKKLKVFSANPGKMNFWFGLINGVNLLFGAYFLVNAVKAGVGTVPLTGIAGLLFGYLSRAGLNPFPIIGIGLGFVPLLFSFFFWLIPAIRLGLLKRENAATRLANFRALGFGRIWSNPLSFRPQTVQGGENCRPLNPGAACDRLVKDMAAYTESEVTIDGEQSEVFSFPGLRREKDALEKYRRTMAPGGSSAGKIIFDSMK